MEVLFMSPFATTPAPTPVQPTRRQLDELDALLQRMLELPVHQVKEEPEPSELADEPAISTSSDQAIEETSWTDPPPALEPEAHSVAPAETFPSESPASQFLWNPEESETAFSLTDPSVDDEPYSNDSAAGGVEIEEPQDKDSLPSDEEDSAPWVLGPLLWVDHLYESVAAGLGKPGFWLRGPSGRAFLGGLGLAGLGLAGALAVLERIGWPR
jgi:hypothetical protein